MIPNYFLPLKSVLAIAALVTLSGCGGTLASNAELASPSDTLAAASDITIDTQSSAIVVDSEKTLPSTNVTSVATISAAAPAVITAINVGGGDYTGTDGVHYLADKYFTGGEPGYLNAEIAGTLDDALYQSERWGSFSYNIPVPNGTYSVTLQFSELVFGINGGRLFDVVAEGVPVLKSFDIFSLAGTRTALDKVISVQVSDGVLSLQFAAIKDQASLEGIVVRGTTTVTAVNSYATAVKAINVGGPAYTNTNGLRYVADQYYTGGNLGSSSLSIGNTRDPALYQTERWGNFSYNIPLPNGRYDVKLQFCELVFGTVGSRVFTVSAEGAPVIYNLDIFKVAGLRKVIDLIVTTQVNDGMLSLQFVASRDTATLEGIIIRAAATSSSSSSSSSSGGVSTGLLAPTNLTSSNVLNKQLTLNWASSGSGVTQYQILRNNQQVAVVSGSVFNYVDTGLAPDTSYTYTIKARNSAGAESPSSAAFVAKTMVVGGFVTLEWTQPTAREGQQGLSLSEIGGYQIRYKLRSEPDSAYRSETVSADKTSFSFLNLVGDYVFGIATYDTNGLYSDYVFATLQ